MTPRFKIAEIQRVVAEEFGLTAAELRAKSNEWQICRPRMMAMYLCRKLTNCSFGVIGREFGAKHHTTVLHGVRRARQLIETDEELFSAYERIAEKLSVLVNEKLDKRPIIQRLKDVERKVDAILGAKQDGPIRILVSPAGNPTPGRELDYEAHLDGLEEAGSAFGRTPEEARCNLEEKNLWDSA